MNGDAMNRPILALTLLSLFYVLSFGIRTYLHFRRTGSSGFRGISRQAGLLGWLGGVSFAIAIVLGAAAPIAEMLGIVPPLFEPHRASALAGLLLALLGIAGTWWAQSSMGQSWRIGVQEDERTELID